MRPKRGSGSMFETRSHFRNRCCYQHGDLEQVLFPSVIRGPIFGVRFPKAPSACHSGPDARKLNALTACTHATCLLPTMCSLLWTIPSAAPGDPRWPRWPCGPPSPCPRAPRGVPATKQCSVDPRAVWPKFNSKGPGGGADTVQSRVSGISPPTVLAPARRQPLIARVSVQTLPALRPLAGACAGWRPTLHAMHTNFDRWRNRPFACPPIYAGPTRAIPKAELYCCTRSPTGFGTRIQETRLPDQFLPMRNIHPRACVPGEPMAQDAHLPEGFPRRPGGRRRRSTLADTPRAGGPGSLMNLQGFRIRPSKSM